MSKYFCYLNNDKKWKLILRWIYTLIVSPLIHLYINIHFLFHKNKSKKNKVSICAIFKDEASFLTEWLNYHIIIGIDHFYLYNNNSSDNYLNVLKPYIDKGIVDLIDWPQEFPQMPAYQNCYEQFACDSEWIAYIDIDEFICPIYKNKINEWLDKYKKYPCVVMYWKVFGTNGFLDENNDLFITESYTSCYPNLMNMGKCIINTNYYFYKFNTPHLIYSSINILSKKIYIPPINEFKKFINKNHHRVGFKPATTIQLNHYWSKSYATFLKNKVRRTDVYSKQNELYNKLVLLLPGEHRCICKDFTIQKYLLELKMFNINSIKHQ